MCFHVSFTDVQPVLFYERCTLTYMPSLQLRCCKLLSTLQNFIIRCYAGETGVCVKKSGLTFLCNSHTACTNYFIYYYYISCAFQLLRYSGLQWAKMRKKVHFDRTKHLLPQRLKSTFFENFWNFFSKNMILVFEVIVQPPKSTFKIGILFVF